MRAPPSIFSLRFNGTVVASFEIIKEYIAYIKKDNLSSTDFCLEEGDTISRSIQCHKEIFQPLEEKQHKGHPIFFVLLFVQSTPEV